MTKTLQYVIAIPVFCMVMSCLVYSMVQRFYIQPKDDVLFLGTHPSMADVRLRFGNPEEELKSGETFPMTGWYPLPKRAASHAAWSFTQRNGCTLYIFFGADGRVEEFVVGRS